MSITRSRPTLAVLWRFSPPAVRLALAISTFACCCCLAEPPLKRTLQGRVVDPSGAAIAGARVVAGATVSVFASGGTDQKGEFSLALPPGSYTLTVAADGFAEATRDVVVNDDSDTPVEIRLQVARRADMVTVVEGSSYRTIATGSATRLAEPLINIPQAISIITSEVAKDQMMMSIADVVRYVPGVTAIQGENNRDQIVMRGNSSSADFFVNGLRDDVQYYRDLYNTERVEALKGPNAMTFGRGGGGGVINRVTKEAAPADLRELDVQLGAFGRRRVAGDWNRALGQNSAFRLNSVYENSDSFRRYVGLERYGFSPTLTLSPDAKTRVVLGYEYFNDGRVADRGVPSFSGRPSDVAASTFFGNPADSRVWATVNLGSARLERQLGPVNLRNATLIGDYDRGYQNYVPGAVNAARTLVAMSAYNNATNRRNLFNQTDLSMTASTGTVRHALLWGAEFGRQATTNFRQTGYFNDSATSVSIPFADPVVSTPVTFRQSATDADNRVRTNTAAAYIQDHIDLSRWVQLLAGVRVDRFDLTHRNNRTNETLGRIDHLVSPRAGLVFKPAARVSVYGSYGVSYLPSSGDQFASLTSVTQQVKPEKFTNYELGVKWDPRRDLSVTTAVYRLDRTNTRSVDPNDPTRIVQTGSQRSNGVEVGLSGAVTRRWQVVGGYALQEAFVTSATVSAKAGAQVAQVPRHTFSIWNNYQVMRRFSAGLGILNRADMFAGIDNTVVLPGYTRADAALFYSITEKIRVQANVQNLFDRGYYLNADSNNNISPGSPRSIQIGLIARF